MKDEKWKFEPEDFDNGELSAKTFESLAIIANAKLAKWIAESPVVYSDNATNWGPPISGDIDKYKARVIYSEPVVKDTAESLLRDMLTASRHDEAFAIRFIDRARKLLEGK